MRDKCHANAEELEVKILDFVCDNFKRSFRRANNHVVYHECMTIDSYDSSRACINVCIAEIENGYANFVIDRWVRGEKVKSRMVSYSLMDYVEGKFAKTSLDVAISDAYDWFSKISGKEIEFGEKEFKDTCETPNTPILKYDSKIVQKFFNPIKAERVGYIEYNLETCTFKCNIWLYGKLQYAKEIGYGKLSDWQKCFKLAQNYILRGHEWSSSFVQDWIKDI